MSTPDASAVQKWVNDLDSEKFSIRDKAAKELKLLGESAGLHLEAILAGNPSSEASSAASNACSPKLSRLESLPIERWKSWNELATMSRSRF